MIGAKRLDFCKILQESNRLFFVGKVIKISNDKNSIQKTSFRFLYLLKKFSFNMLKGQKTIT